MIFSRAFLLLGEIYQLLLSPPLRWAHSLSTTTSISSFPPANTHLILLPIDEDFLWRDCPSRTTTKKYSFLRTPSSSSSPLGPLSFWSRVGTTMMAPVGHAPSSILARALSSRRRKNALFPHHPEESPSLVRFTHDSIIELLLFFLIILKENQLLLLRLLPRRQRQPRKEQRRLTTCFSSFFFSRQL